MVIQLEEDGTSSTEELWIDRGTMLVLKSIIRVREAFPISKELVTRAEWTYGELGREPRTALFEPTPPSNFKRTNWLEIRDH